MPHIRRDDGTSFQGGPRQLPAVRANSSFVSSLPLLHRETPPPGEYHRWIGRFETRWLAKRGVRGLMSRRGGARLFWRGAGRSRCRLWGEFVRRLLPPEPNHSFFVSWVLTAYLRPDGYTAKMFWSSPLGPLLFQNESSDARDHCANERSKNPCLRPPIPPSRKLDKPGSGKVSWAIVEAVG